ncbi:Hypothetical protein UVM_LOCUS50 [uncultured virus]|nr:Hypothetical protein UVM_LOCUS50 [uncultured virus]
MGYGVCNSTVLAAVQKGAIESCQATTNPGDFANAIQATVNAYGFSSLAVDDVHDIGFYICLDRANPCYVLGSVGPIGLFLVFISQSGPCDGVLLRANSDQN